MKKIFYTLSFLILIVSVILTLYKSTNKETHIMTPKAQKIPQQLENFADVRVDNYAWLRSKNWQTKVDESEILNYLNEENKYAETFMDSVKDLREQLFTEMKSRIKLADKSVPVKEDNYFYYSYTHEDSNYAIYARKKDSLDNEEEIIFDQNIAAQDYEYFDVEDISVSPNHQLVAYSTDINGSERYTIQVKDLTNNIILSDQITDTLGSIVWHENSQGFFYTPVDEHWRTQKVYFHKLGDDPKNDQLIYQEKDNSFSVNISKSASKKFIFMDIHSHDCNEVRYINLADSGLKEHLIKTRADQQLYDVDHAHNKFYMITNDKGKNFRLISVNEDKLADNNWIEIIPHRENIYLTDFDLFTNHLVITERDKGLNNIRVIDLCNNEEHNINFPESAYLASVMDTNFEDNLRITYSALSIPDSVLEYDFTNKRLTTLKVREIPSGYNPKEYVTERIYALSRDGVEIPISLVYKKDLFKKDGSNPLYLYGYGSYGHSIAANFRTNILSLVDRGFIFAIAHIRGGDDLGYRWYEDAKYLTKRNTFLDFVNSAEYLIDNKYTTKNNIVIAGGSAGGMLVGVAINEFPELFKAAIAHVPFVDVLNTMLDDTLPLTPGEFKEWGNPKQADYYHYIKSYSPYDNIKPQNYPALYVTAGLNDPRVTYWEPAKWVAKLREIKTDKNPIIFEINMGQGHGGATKRFDYLKEAAKEYAFILKTFNIMHESTTTITNQNISKVEQTLSIIKPNAVKRNLTEQINKKFTQAGLKIIKQKQLTLNEEQAKELYAIHKDKPFFQDLIDFITSGPIIVQILEGEDAINKNRKIMGAANPEKAAPGTIRKEFGEDTTKNSIHGADSKENAAREIKIFFPDH